MEPLIIKVSRGGRSQPVFHRVSHSPFSIGRAYDNDLIIDDDTVSAYHLRLVYGEAGWEAQDCQSENGSWVDNSAIGDQPHPLHGPVNIEIGHTHLNLFGAETPVTPTRLHKRSSRLSETCSRLPVAFTLLAAFFLLTLYQAWERLALGRQWQQILVSELPTFLLPVIVALATGFFSRIFLHNWRFGLQLSIASITFISLLLLDTLEGFVSYLFTSAGIAHYIVLLLMLCLFTALLVWQIMAVSSIGRHRALVASLLIIPGLFSVLELQRYVEQPVFRSQPRMHTLLRQHDWRLADTDSSLDDFLTIVSSDLQADMAAELARVREEELETPADPG